MTRSKLQQAYKLLYKRFGPQHWWPGDSPFEVMVGAILTQNTNWGNVEKAIGNLKLNSLLDPHSINDLRPSCLASLIRPTGYYNVKTKRLKNFVSLFVKEFDGDHGKLKKLSLPSARQWLLGVNGIGQETADSILLYALKKPIFVVDAYTKRVLERHSLVPEEVAYNEIQEIFMDHLEPGVKLFNEYHALIVRVCKEFCKRNPKCDTCPLNGWNGLDRPDY
jgi:endonuclease-3 related protein